MYNGLKASFMLGDKFLVSDSTVILAGKLQRHSHILNYHHIWESQSKGIIKYVHMNVNENLDDAVTKGRASITCFSLIEHILFWSDIDFLKERVVSEVSEYILSTYQ